MGRFALFDFDSTLTSKDTTRYLLFELIRLRPWKSVHLFGLIAARACAPSSEFQFAKNRCIGACLKGLTQERIEIVCARFHNRVRRLLLPSVLERARECREAGVQVVVVTASPEFAIAPLFKCEGFLCVGTLYSRVGAVYDGALAGPPCYAEQKVSALLARCLSAESEIVEAWSDSISDLPMMALAEKRFWVCEGRDWKRIKEIDPDGIQFSRF